LAGWIYVSFCIEDKLRLRLREADYGFFPLAVSYISCTNIIHYDDQVLAAFDHTPLGRLSDNHLKELSAAIIAGGAMAEWEMQRVCNAIASG
jgi:hypothetical protein